MVENAAMKAFFTSAYPEERTAVDWLKESAKIDPFGVHSLANTPEEADIVVFAETHPAQDLYLLRARFHPLYRKFRARAFVYHDWYVVLPIYAGLFPNQSRTRAPFPCASFHYLARRCENDAIAFDSSTERPYLFSFVGSSRTASLRREVFSLNHPRAFLKDTGEARAWNMNRAQKENYEGDYAKVMAQSKFVLCPRGLGPASYRLFETMEMGRAPVIISDDWQFPVGPNWNEFSFQVPESDIAKIPEILEQNEARALEMGWAARRAWEEWCSQRVSFHRVVEACAALQSKRSWPQEALCQLALLGLLWPSHLRNLIRNARHRFRKPQRS